ncbi:MAG: hypothetical protein NTU73_12680 [Ignavibacteriae bacterium]|nr:hypothetical protein [Ignavibacteriota bacterium]
MIRIITGSKFNIIVSFPNMLLKLKSLLFICIIVFAFNQTTTAQLEFVSASHPVYEFLKNMQIKGVIKDYNSSNIPISRNEVSNYLKRIESSSLLSKTDRKILGDLKIEFEYELYKTLKSSTSIFKNFDEESVSSNKKQKYLYNYSDSRNADFRASNSDLGDHSILLGDIGLKLRGTLFDKVGYSIAFLEGKRFYGNNADLEFAIENDPMLKSNPNLSSGNNNYDFFNGYIRYQTKNNWLALTLGREAVYCGYGYIDRLFLSNNTVPIDFLKFDLSYKKIKYTFTYGSIKGDSLGVDLKSKNIAFHRLNVQFSDVFKVGYFESVVMSNIPFSFVYFNPISFLTSADLNTGRTETVKNNTLMGFDFEFNPVTNLGLQGTLLIDDINFSTLFKSDMTSNDNKIGYQLGTVWTNAFTIPDITLALEYTRLNPFVYSHRSNKDSYTHWGYSLGHALHPNSDEIAVKIHYNLTNRLKLNLLYQFQRSAEGIYYDSVSNKIINYGGNINRGDGDYVINNKFLLGDRINRNIFTADLTFEPIKQYFIRIEYQYKLLNMIFLSKNNRESYFRTTFYINF